MSGSFSEVYSFTEYVFMDMFLLADKSDVLFSLLYRSCFTENIQRTLHTKGYIRSAMLCFI